MQDNQGNEIKLVIGGYEIAGWNNAVADSQIDTPAENWSLNLFHKNGQPLPEGISGGSHVQLYFANQLILTSIADRVQEGINRDGYGLEISGRDLVG
ncbi:hypothetical protein I6M67_19145, partial [Acinetobacter pittii]|nr:hypothetical protein [Acinetobacter pittii]